MVRVRGGGGNAVGIGSCEPTGRDGRDWFQIGPDAPRLGKAPIGRKSSLLCKCLSLSDLRLIQVPFRVAPFSFSGPYARAATRGAQGLRAVH